MLSIGLAREYTIASRVERNSSATPKSKLLGVVLGTLFATTYKHTGISKSFSHCSFGADTLLLRLRIAQFTGTWTACVRCRPPSLPFAPHGSTSRVTSRASRMRRKCSEAKKQPHSTSAQKGSEGEGGQRQVSGEQKMQGAVHAACGRGSERARPAARGPVLVRG